MSDDIDPLVSPPPPEVPLGDAPLVRVIAQVRFPQILSVEKGDFVAPFQEALRGKYPLFQENQARGVRVDPSGFATFVPQVAWRLSSADGNWRVSLTPDFLAFETAKYTSRADYFARFGAVVHALAQHIEPTHVTQLGVRYIDRITGDALGDIDRLVREEVRGIKGKAVGTHASLVVSQSLFELPNTNTKVSARWGHLPPNATTDPAALEPIAEPSFILDLDMIGAELRPFAVDAILTEAEQYSRRIYTIFRWVVTDAFLRRYGGEV